MSDRKLSACYFAYRLAYQSRYACSVKIGRKCSANICHDALTVVGCAGGIFANRFVSRSGEEAVRGSRILGRILPEAMYNRRDVGESCRLRKEPEKRGERENAVDVRGEDDDDDDTEGEFGRGRDHG